MNLIITGKMGNGTIQAKLEPLSRIEHINTIFFLRKSQGPAIPKVRYLILPKLCKIPLVNIIITPFILAWYTVKTGASHIISYHIIPHAFFAALAGFLTRKPYFVCQTGLTIQSKSNNKLFWVFLKRVLIKSKKICVPGNQSLTFWGSKGIPDSKIMRLHSTVDTEKLKPGLFRDRPFDFIYTGRIAVEKRLDFLIAAFHKVIKNHPKAQLIVVGDGPLLKDIMQLATTLKLNNNITFCGYHENVNVFLEQARFIVMTSETEGLPCSIMEGMSVGLIPITINVGNLSDIVIHNETGYLTSPEDITEFAEYLDYLYVKEEHTLHHIREKARKTIVRDHSHDHSSKKWEQLLLQGSKIKP
jgi:glycosyltransferase involved in cell wall biosynthesis